LLKDKEKGTYIYQHTALQFKISAKVSKLIVFSERYPIPIFATIGLLLGIIIHYVLNYPDIAHWIWLIVLVIGGAPIIFETIKGMLHKHFASDIIATLAIITAIMTNEAFPGVIIVIMQSGGRALEDYAFRKATSSLDELMARSPKKARRKINDNEIEDIKVEEIRIGDHLVIRPGDLVPVDGTIVSKTAQIDESSLTGEPLSKVKYAGEEVFSGTVNTDEIFEIIAKRISEDSQYSKIVKLVKKARQEKAPLQRLADKYAVWFTPITLAVCGLGWLLTQNPQTILSVLVVATPCPLIFATPVAIISGINKASKQSIIVKSGAAIEQLSKVDAVVFDKTGTITYGTPIVEDIMPLDSAMKNENENSKSESIEYAKDKENILFYAASLEQMSSHSSAQAIVKAAKEKFNSFPLPANVHERPGLGVEGYANGKYVMVGSPIFIKSGSNRNTNTNENITSNNITSNNNSYLMRTINDIQKQGKTVALVNINGINTGLIIFSDKIREGVVEMIKNLKKAQIKKMVMLTGDSLENAKFIASQATIDDYKHNLLPEDKVIEVKKLKEKFKNTVMIGDGINDAPALTTATVGIAMGAKGTAISAEAADVVLLVDDLTKVSNIIQISKRTINIAKQSIFVGLGISFLLMIFASFGLIPPTIGALFQEALDIGVILNAIRAR
jgi:heavy metal translocating P-type ATPase